MKIRFLSLNFALEDEKSAKSIVRVNFEFTFLGFTPKEVEISEMTGFFFFYRIINLDRWLGFSGENTNCNLQKDSRYYFSH